MARFPERDANIKALSETIITGLTANAADFPAPPVNAAQLQTLLDDVAAPI